MVTLDQPHQIEWFKLRQVMGRLELEVKGMQFSQPTLKLAKRYYHLDVRTKAQALEILREANAKILAHPTQIWVILARVRGSKVFIACDHCGWQGDQFTADDYEESWHCPQCRHDESALVITPIEEVVTLA